MAKPSTSAKADYLNYRMTPKRVNPDSTMGNVGAPMQPKTRSQKGCPLTGEELSEPVNEAGRRRSEWDDAGCRELLGVDDNRAYYLLKALCDQGRLVPRGVGKGRRYTLP